MQRLKLLTKKLTRREWVIYHEDLFTHGYVELGPLSAAKQRVRYPTIGEAKQNATRFYFKFIAEAICWLLNKQADYFQTYKLEKAPKVKGL